MAGKSNPAKIFTLRSGVPCPTDAHVEKCLLQQLRQEERLFSQEQGRADSPPSSPKRKKGKALQNPHSSDYSFLACVCSQAQGSCQEEEKEGRCCCCRCCC